MMKTLLFVALLTTSLGTPVPQATTPTWEPAVGSKAECDTGSDKILNTYQGIQISTVIENACADMQPCFYPPDNTDMACTKVLDRPLKGPVKSVQNATVMTDEGNKISGWDAQLTVTPPSPQEGSAGTMWRKEECFGYFNYMLSEYEDKGGCHYEKGARVGSMTVGGDSSLKGTVFEVTIVSE